MTPERWEQVKKVFAAALDRQPEARSGFLSQACGSDSALRGEVERLLSEFRQAEKLMEQPLPGASTVTLPPPWESCTFAQDELVAGRYRIMRFIGRGGMGEVYEAQDQELGDAVALKTFRPGLAQDKATIARFKQEIQLARKVTHPNVCRIFDLGRHQLPPQGEVTFLTMELLSGETLAQRIRGAGPMSPAAALPLVEQMAEALCAAHRAGIVHRDFKSSNVMLVPSSEGTTRVAVTDFGVAHSMAVSQADEAPLTRPGQIVGTPAYMAPEQLEGGEGTVASDLYALGVVLYEMMTGCRPFKADTPASQRVAPSPRAHVPDLDPRWEAAILGCLERNPENRFASAEEVVRAIRVGSATATVAPAGTVPRQGRRARAQRPLLSLALGLVSLALVVALLGPAILNWFSGVPKEKHIAVLPFKNVGSDPANQAFCEGVVETLTSRLSQLEQFHSSFWVVPASEIRGIGDPAQARRALGVTLAVTGSIERSGSNVRLIANLIDAGSRKQLASRTIDAGVAEISRLEDRTWAGVADMLRLAVEPDAKRKLSEGSTPVPGAYDFYEQGLGYVKRHGLDNYDRAIELFKQALGKDPSYALAYAGLGEAYSKKYAETKDPQWVEEARRSGLRAVQLDDKLAPVHLTLGQVYKDTGHLTEAVGEFRRTLEIDPAAVDAHIKLGATYYDLGKPEEAEESFQKAVNLRPGYGPAYSGLGWFYSNRGRYEEAVTQFRTVISLAPDNLLAHQNLGGVYLKMGRYDEAIAILKKSIELKPTGVAYSNLAATYMGQGRYREAVPVMEEAVKLLPARHVLWRNLGEAYQWSGQPAKAPPAYERALKVAQDVLAVSPQDPQTLSSLALYWAKLGQKQNARTRLAQALKLAPLDNEVNFKSALIYELTGDRNRAIAAIKAAWKGGYSLVQIEKEPELAPLRTDQRYREWRQEIGKHS